MAVSDDDLETALKHVRYAKKLAGRVSVVRESAGVIEYLAGEYGAALNEFRAVRRMTGSDEFIAMMADCERGLGRPEKALDFLKSVPMDKLSKETQLEALLVAAGARSDLGQLDAALVMLNIPALTTLPAGDHRARLQEAYSDLLERAGRAKEAETWRAKALKSDINGVTALATQLAESQVSVELLEETD
jgi:tetratricopeptide (TPR) repeat protein